MADDGNREQWNDGRAWNSKDPEENFWPIGASISSKRIKADPTCFRVNIVFFISYKASSFNVIGKFKRERKNRSNWRKFNIIIIKYTLMSLKQILLDKYDLIQWEDERFLDIKKGNDLEKVG